MVLKTVSKGPTHDNLLRSPSRGDCCDVPLFYDFRAEWLDEKDGYTRWREVRNATFYPFICHQSGGNKG